MSKPVQPEQTSTKVRNDFLEFNQFIKNIREESVNRKIVIIEYVSIILTAGCFFLTAYLAYDDNSITALAICIDSFLDVLAYIICIWRYHKVTDKQKDRAKDIKASIFLAVLFLASSFWVEVESIKSYLDEEKPLKSFSFIAIALFQSAVFSILSIIKFYLAQKITLNSVIISDGINSIVASLSNLSMAISMSMYMLDNEIWYLDSIFGFFIGILVFIYGTQLLMSNVCFLDDDEA